MVRITALKLFFLQELAQHRLPGNYRLGNQPKGAAGLSIFSLVRLWNGDRGLIRIIHGCNNIFFQFAQPLFFLFFLFRQIFLTLFILVVRLCQFVVPPAARLDR